MAVDILLTSGDEIVSAMYAVGVRRDSSPLCAQQSTTHEPKRQAAFRWLGDEAEARRLREEQTHHYVRWTFFAAVAAVIVGLIGVGLALLH